MVIVDTGPWVALFTQGDAWSARTQKAFVTYAQEGFITTMPVLVEASHLIAARSRRRELPIRFLEAIAAMEVTVAEVPLGGLPEAARLMEKYSSFPMDLADASLVMLAERLGHGRILSTDVRDFHAYRFKNQHPFQNLLESMSP